MDQAEGLDEPTRLKAQFYLRQLTSALSPSNFVLTNPELIRQTLAENGANLVRGMTMLAAWYAVRGLVWARRAGNGRLRRFYRITLGFAALEYALWTSSCFWVSDTLTNPYFWFDFLLTAALPLFLPAVRKAVDT